MGGRHFKYVDDGKMWAILRWMSGRISPPYILELRPTNRCNLTCSLCWHSRTGDDWDYSVELPGETLTAIVREAAAMGISRLEVGGGGEPMFRRADTMALMEAAKDGGMAGSLTTNATLFKKEDITRLVEAGWDEILFSIDGPDAAVHDRLRKSPGCFEKSIETCRTFRDEKERLGVERPELKFVPIFTNLICHRLDEMIALAAGAGANEVRFQPLYVLDHNQSPFQPNDEQFAALRPHVERAHDLADRHSIDTNAEAFVREAFVDESTEIYRSDVERVDRGEFFSTICYFPWMYIGIRPNGTIAPCVAFNEFEEVDNIRHKGLAEVWEGPTFTDFREKMMRQIFHACCKECCGGLIIDNQKIRKQLHILAEKPGALEKAQKMACDLQDDPGDPA